MKNLKNVSDILKENLNFTFEDLKKNMNINEKELLVLLEKHFLQIQKKDFHCHLSMGVSQDEIIYLILMQNNNEFTKILFNLIQKSHTKKRAFLIKIIIKLTPLFLLKNKFSLSKLIKLSGALRSWNNADFFITNKEIFEKTIELTLKNYLQDNVVKLSIRMNPFKKNISQKNNIVDIFIDTLLSTTKVIDKITKEYNNVDITITLSLTREKEKENIRSLEIILEEWEKIPEKLKEKIHALDIAGPEGGTLIYLKKWEKIINNFSKYNIHISPHLGDIRNLNRHDPIYNKWNEFLKTKNKIFLLELIDEHSNYIRKWLEIIPQEESIAHGISISERIVFLHMSNYFIFDLTEKIGMEQLDNFRLKILHKIHNIKKIIIEKKISIYFSPSTTLKSTNRSAFQYLPLYEWLQNGICTKIGIDGIFQYPHKKTLSKDLTNLFTTKPKYGDYLTYKNILQLVQEAK